MVECTQLTTNHRRDKDSSVSFGIYTWYSLIRLLTIQKVKSHGNILIAT